MNEITITDAYDLGELLRLALVRVAELEADNAELLDSRKSWMDHALALQDEIALAAVRQEKP
jgi:hypothetical protein